MYKVVYDIDYGFRGDRRNLEVYFEKRPTKAIIKETFNKNGYAIENWDAVEIEKIEIGKISTNYIAD